MQPLVTPKTGRAPLSTYLSLQTGSTLMGPPTVEPR